MIKISFDQLDFKIDSILSTFGVKQDWITTEKGQKKPAAKASWFTKIVLIPKDLSSAEVNLDISSYLNEARFSSRVNEEIISKDITIYINDPDSTKPAPAAIIQLIHSDKVKRNGGTIAIILDKVNEFGESDLDKFILRKNEFSFVFPRSLDDIEIQHKLLQHKKDVLINLTIGAEDNYEADFNTSLDEKAIRERIRNFNSDFSTVNKVLLTKTISGPALNQLQTKITAELARYNITVISDSLLTAASESSEKERIGAFFDMLVQKTALNKSAIAVFPVEKSEFPEFYNRLLALKKLGYKFLNLTEYLSYTREEQKKEQERLEKLKQEQLKMKKKEDAKKKKTVNKKETKKKSDSKSPEKKKK